MPLQGVITSFTEKRDHIKCFIPLKGTPSSAIDIFVTPTTLKVNFAPYLIDIVLKGRIDPLRHKAMVKEGVLQITLFKESQCLWHALEASAEDLAAAAATTTNVPAASEGMQDAGKTEKKEAIKSFKQQAIAEQLELEHKMEEVRKDRKIDDERFALRKQMALEEGVRNKLDNLKAEEKSAAEEEVYKTFAQMKQNQEQKQQQQQQQQQQQKQKSSTSSSQPSASVTTTASNGKDIFDFAALIEEEGIDEDDMDESEGKRSHRASSTKERQEITQEEGEEEEEANEVVEDSLNESEGHFIPPSRSAGASNTSESKVSIEFTPRVFPTPLRESKAAEEEDWIAKNRRHLKHHAGLHHTRKGKDISEEDPTWLKAKGDDFFRSGDVRSALNAYSSAIDADESMLPCYGNRAACYLKLEMFHECKLDCSVVIDKLTVTVTENPTEEEVNMLVKNYIRRGAASCQLGIFVESLADYTAALTKVTAANGTCSAASESSLKDDVSRLQLMVDADKAKKEGDKLFANRQVAQAIEKYTTALSLVPVHVGCLSNRAACWMASSEWSKAVEDCTLAVDLLYLGTDSSEPTSISAIGLSKSSTFNMLSSILPPKGSAKRKEWVMKTVVRRGAAFFELGNLDGAIRDYGIAASLDPTDEKLKLDLNKLVNTKAQREISSTQANSVNNIAPVASN